MIKIRITRKWKRQGQSKNSMAQITIGKLWCYDAAWSEGIPSWRGEVSISGFIRRGGIRRSEAKAQQDAEKLAIELLLDIGDATKELMIQFDIGEDD